MEQQLTKRENNRAEKYREQTIVLKATVLKLSGEFAELKKQFDEAKLQVARLNYQLNKAKEKGFVEDEAVFTVTEITDTTMTLEDSSDRDQSQQI